MNDANVFAEGRQKSQDEYLSYNDIVFLGRSRALQNIDKHNFKELGSIIGFRSIASDDICMRIKAIMDLSKRINNKDIFDPSGIRYSQRYFPKDAKYCNEFSLCSSAPALLEKNALRESIANFRASAESFDANVEDIIEPLARALDEKGKVIYTAPSQWKTTVSQPS